MAMMGGVELNAEDAAKSAAATDPALTKISHRSDGQIWSDRPGRAGPGGSE